MFKCQHCHEQLPSLKVRRNWKEKYITHRRHSKYRCEKCVKITFVKIR